MQSHLRIESGKPAIPNQFYPPDLRGKLRYHYYDQKNAIKADVYSAKARLVFGILPWRLCLPRDGGTVGRV